MSRYYYEVLAQMNDFKKVKQDFADNILDIRGASIAGVEFDKYPGVIGNITNTPYRNGPITIDYDAHDVLFHFDASYGVTLKPNSTVIDYWNCLNGQGTLENHSNYGSVLENQVNGYPAVRSNLRLPGFKPNEYFIAFVAKLNHSLSNRIFFSFGNTRFGLRGGDEFLIASRDDDRDTYEVPNWLDWDAYNLFLLYRSPEGRYGLVINGEAIFPMSSGRWAEGEYNEFTSNMYLAEMYIMKNANIMLSDFDKVLMHKYGITSRG